MSESKSELESAFEPRSESEMNPKLNARQRLRDLIDVLEERYLSMPEDATFLAQSETLQASLPRKDDVTIEMPVVYSELRSHSDTLEELAGHMRREAMIGEAKWNRMRNSRLPVYRLPPEILAHIFEHTLLSKPVANLFITGPGSLHNRRKHLIMTCYYWRSVALGAAPLWNRLVVTHETATRSLASNLDRLGAPVDVFIYARNSILESWLVAAKTKAALERCRVLNGNSSGLKPGQLALALRSPNLRTAILTYEPLTVHVGQLDFSSAQALQYLWIDFRSRTSPINSLTRKCLRPVCV